MSEPTLQQLTDQLHHLTQRVAALEKELNLGRSAEPASALEVRTAPASPQPLAENLHKPESRGRAVQTLESSVGLQLVNRVGAVTLTLGIAFFFRYAVENQWIGETARVLSAAAAGLLLLAGGEFASRKSQRVFAQGVTGAGAAILYLSFYAAFAAYHLISLPAAFAAMAAATAIAGYLARRYNAQPIAVLALFGGLLAPMLLKGTPLNPWFLPLYIGALDGGFLFLAESPRWRFCEWLALIGTALFTFNMDSTPLQVLLPLYYLLFATRDYAASFLVAHVLFMARATYLPHWLSIFAPQLIAMSFAGLAIVRWREWFRFSGFLVTVAGLSWFASLSSAHLPLGAALATLTLLFAMFFAASFLRAREASDRLHWAEVAAVPLNGIFYFAASYAQLAGSRTSGAALLAAGLAALHFAAAYRLRDLPLPNLAGMMTAAVGAGFLTVAIPIEFSAFRITVAWAMEGSALIWIAARRSVRRAQVLGLAILLFAVLHFALIDLQMYSSATGHALLINARFATAVGVAAALFLSAFWSVGTSVSPAIAGVTGHLVLLSAIAAEVFDWATLFHAANRANVASSTVSILFAVYAVLLVALGTGTRSVGNRYVGLGIIALVVVKLYLYDIWRLDMVYRFVAFAALGALLLTVSFLYSRYRERVSFWLKTESATSPGVSAARPQQPPE